MDNILVRMSQPVIIENDFVRMEVYPHIGGKVASMFDKADKFDLMFDYPVELPTRPQYDIPFDDSWYAGWDECFPAVAPGKYPLHPYEGITTVYNGLRFGYRLTRKLHLEGAEIVAEYTLINLAPFEFRYVWSMHSLMSMKSPVQLDLQTPASFRFSHDELAADHQQLFDWPMISPELNVADFSTLPDRRGWKLFSMQPIDQPLKVRYPSRGRSLSIQYSSPDELPAYWGIWINTGGWAGNRAFSIEPTTGRFDQLDRAVGDGSPGRVSPTGRCEWSVRWTLSDL